jgi:hypothetical protein
MQMMIVVCIAGAATLGVLAYGRLQNRSPEASTGRRRAVRELAAFLLVLLKAVDDANVVAHQPVQAASATSNWSYRNYEFDEDKR